MSLGAWGKKKTGNSLRNISGVFQLSFSNRNVFKPNMQKLSSYYLYYLNYITVIVLYVNINVFSLTVNRIFLFGHKFVMEFYRNNTINNTNYKM